MKRLSIIAAFLLLASSVANSQIDSIPYNVNFPYYYMMHPIDSLRVSSHDGVRCQPAFRTVTHAATTRWCGIPYSETEKKVALGFYPDTTIHVIGLAFVKWGLTVIQGSIYDYTLQHEMDLYTGLECKMYVPYGNTLQMIDSATITIGDMNPDKYRLYQYSMDYDENVAPWHPYYGDLSSRSSQYFIFEAFFNNEVTVSDSIFFSVKNAGLCGWYEFHTPGSSHYTYPPLSYRIADTSATADDPWEQGVTYCYPLVFPIIRRDCDSCPQVRGVELFKGSSTQFFLRWANGENHRDWQVSYGPAGTAPDDGTMLACSQRQSALITVDPDSHYVAYVRARCRFARDEWGPWSDPIDVHLNAPSNGIDDAGATALTLSPNPASGTVSVDCESSEGTIEVVDMQGRIVLTAPATEHTLDISRLVAGSYVVRLTTTEGTAVRRLQVD